MANFDEFYREFISALSEAVDNGRIVGETSEERAESCINEVEFQLRVQNIEYSHEMVVGLVRRHYKGA